MRIDTRLFWLAVAVVCLWVIANAAAQAAEPLQLTKAGEARFPARSFVLTLPEERSLTTADVHLSENGAAVDGFTVTPGDAAGPKTFGVILAIDASDSMQGAAIDDAMAAARAFAARRQPNQALGVIFFSRSPRLALAPTTDAARIDAVLAAAPPLTHGTRIYDATHTALDVLHDAGISSGSIVLLSDGADGNSAVSPAQLGTESRRAGARVFGVGLRSAGYDGAALDDLANLAGGTYAEASDSKDLAGIFDALGRRLGNQYLVEYRSMAPLGARVEVQAEVAGIAGSARAVYQAPTFTAPSGTNRDERRTVLDSRYAPLILAFVLAAVIGFITFVLLRPGKRSVRSRIAGFVAGDQPDEQADRKPRRPPALAQTASQSLKRSRWWGAFCEMVELSRVPVTPGRLALWTGLGTAALAYLLAVPAGRPVMAVASLGLPLAMFFVIRARVAKERRAFGDQLPENLQVLASAMRAGHSFLGALSVMADDAGEPSRREFRRVLQDEQLGVPVQAALVTVAARMRSPEVEYVGLVAQLQTETGGNTAEVLDRVTETIRERNSLTRLVRVLTAQGRLGGWVVSLLPLGLVVALNLLNPGYLSPLLESSTGRLLLILGGSFMVAGMVAIRKIVDIKV
jgi:tight adherence protein B